MQDTKCSESMVVFSDRHGTSPPPQSCMSATIFIARSSCFLASSAMRTFFAERASTFSSKNWSASRYAFRPRRRRGAWSAVPCRSTQAGGRCRTCRAVLVHGDELGVRLVLPVLGSAPDLVPMGLQVGRDQPRWPHATRRSPAFSMLSSSPEIGSRPRGGTHRSSPRGSEIVKRQPPSSFLTEVVPP